MAAMKFLLIVSIAASSLAVGTSELLVPVPSYGQKLVCSDMYSTVCGGQLIDDPFASDRARFAAINDAKYWPPARDNTSRSVAAQAESPACKAEVDSSGRSFPPERVPVVMAHVTDALCRYAELQSCDPNTRLTSGDVIALSLRSPLPIVALEEKVFEKNTFELHPELPIIQSFSWHSSRQSNNAMHFDDILRRYGEALHELTSLTSDQVEHLLAFLKDLALIQLPASERRELPSTPLCEQHSVWPDWIAEMCKNRTDSVYTKDVAFVYALEAVVRKYAPTLEMVSIITTFRIFDVETMQGGWPLQNRSDYQNNVTHECPSTEEQLLSRLFRYAAGLEDSVGRPFLAEQQTHAQHIVDSIKNTFVNRVWQSDKLGDRTKRIVSSSARNISVQLGLPDAFFDKSWEDIPHIDNNSSNYCDVLPYFRDYSIINAVAIPQCDMIIMMNVLLQPPYLDHKRSVDKYIVYDYAMMGSVFAHELGHHFDPNSRHLIKDNIGSEETLTQLEKQRFYDSVRCYKHDMEHHCCDGEGADRVCTLTHLNQGEDMSDLLSIHLALEAYEVHDLGGDLAKGIARGELDEATGAQKLRQLFFYSIANMWCNWGWQQNRAYFERILDVHSPGKCRVNTAMRQSREFTQAFGCDARTDHMARSDEERCNVWD